MVARQTHAGHGEYVAVQQSSVEQLADQEAHAAGGVEAVHVGLAVGIDLGEQRYNGRQVAKVVPVDANPGGMSDGDQVQGVVGRAASRQRPSSQRARFIASNVSSTADMALMGLRWNPAASCSTLQEPSVSNSRMTSTQRTAVDFAQVIQDLLEVRYPDAEKNGFGDG